MLKKSIRFVTEIEAVDVTPGEYLETKIDRVTRNNEPIRDSAEMIYSERNDGILPGTDIRTDRFDLAIDAMNAVSKSIVAKREYNATNRTDDISKKVEIQPNTDGTEQQQNAG